MTKSDADYNFQYLRRNITVSEFGFAYRRLTGEAPPPTDPGKLLRQLYDDHGYDALRATIAAFDCQHYVSTGEFRARPIED
jgi:hypothetical protein